MSADELRRLGSAICERLGGLEEYAAAQTVFCFVGATREIDTGELLRRALRDGKRLCVPRCTAPGIMELRRITELAQLVPGAFSIMEPTGQAPLVNVDEVQLAVVPCLTCNPQGQRLGRGGGYYDRFLQQYHGFAALVCPECLMRQAIPMEPHDCAVNCVVTERAVYRMGKSI